jgi:uncharacterized protein (UPF0276 family)
MKHHSNSFPGFGLGLRTTHYGDFLEAPQRVDWLEIITDNFLVEGGKPLVMLDRFRRDYPMAMHGVAMSLGAAHGLNHQYLAQVKALADRIEPMWVSDHLCWTGTPSHSLHDLYPLPYTDEAARAVISHIRQAQDVLQRRLVVENVSSYVRFVGSPRAEWEFLTYVANESDCDLLVDVNNIYVSSVNHGFEPQAYLQALPPQRVRQIHLAGHSDCGTHIVDTHDHPVVPAVWALYESACRRFGAVATMIERDDHIPALAELLAELNVAREICDRSAGVEALASLPGLDIASQPSQPTAEAVLGSMQQVLGQWMLGPSEPDAVLALVDSDRPEQERGLSGERGLAIYHNAYRARLSGVLADAHPRVQRYMGEEVFDRHARAFAVQHPPQGGNLNHYGGALADFFASLFPDNPELHELARLDWDLRRCFDGPDVTVLSMAAVQSDSQARWMHVTPALHPSLVLRPITTNVVALWHALDTNEEVPPPEHGLAPRMLAVWRQGLAPSFRTLEPAEAELLQALQAPLTHLAGLIERYSGTALLPDPAALAAHLQQWWALGWLRAPTTEMPTLV